MSKVSSMSVIFPVAVTLDARVARCVDTTPGGGVRRMRDVDNLSLNAQVGGKPKMWWTVPKYHWGVPVPSHWRW